jgi:hypothetical protein
VVRPLEELPSTPPVFRRLSTKANTFTLDHSACETLPPHPALLLCLRPTTHTTDHVQGLKVHLGRAATPLRPPLRSAPFAFPTSRARDDDDEYDDDSRPCSLDACADHEHYAFQAIPPLLWH